MGMCVEKLYKIGDKVKYKDRLGNIFEDTIVYIEPHLPIESFIYTKYWFKNGTFIEHHNCI
jgi:hypothetical protein